MTAISTTSSSKYFSTLLLLIVVSLFSGCASQAQEGSNKENNQLSLKKPNLNRDKQRQWFSLIGKTYLDQPVENGGKREILSTRFIDGTYKFVFRTHDKSGNYNDNIEVGEWGTSEGIYFTIFKGWIKSGKFKKADSRDPYHRDVYRIITLNDDVFIYDSLDGKTRYTSKQVADGFTLKEIKGL